MFYTEAVLITDIKYIPSALLMDLGRMYKRVGFGFINSVTGIKKAIDRAYKSGEYIAPVPVYVYTRAIVSTESKAKLRRYCNGLGVTDVVFKLHV